MTQAREVRVVLREVAAHPVDLLIRKWNWKTAVLTAALRGAIFFMTTIPEGLATAAAVLGRDLLFRVPMGGLYGAVSQAFCYATPAWASYLVVMVAVPAIAHLAEFLVHWLGGTPRLGTAITASIALSAFSALFNLFLMRRGALLVGEPNGGFAGDLKQMPRLLVEFVCWMPIAAAGRLRPGADGARRREAGGEPPRTD